MLRSANHSHHWGIIVAGGEGERLRPLTRMVAGDDRPKQFCALLAGGRTLLQQTQARVAQAIDPSRTLFVLTRQHEHFYADHFATVPSERLVIQPGNRGTFAAILYSLAKVMRQDRNAVVAFFPADHHYTHENRLVAGVG